MGGETVNIRVPGDPELCREILPELKIWLSRVKETLASEINASPWKPASDLEFMGIVFLMKLLSHAESVLLLLPHKDVTLIARAMIEGFVQFLWAARDPDVRPSDWRSYSVVEEFLSLERRGREGRPPTMAMMADLSEALQGVGPRFLTRKAAQALSESRNLPSNPYHTNWRRGVTFRKIFHEVEGGDLHTFLYGQFSGWAHWSPLALASQLDTSVPPGVKWRSHDDLLAAHAAIIAIVCLLHTGGLVFEHAEHPSQEMPGMLRDEFLEWQSQRYREYRDEACEGQ